MKVLLSGGTGLIGSALVKVLVSNQHEVVILSRSPQQVASRRTRREYPQGVQVVGWDGKTENGWGEIVETVDAIVNLAGENIGASPWTNARKEAIEQSRLAAGQALVSALKKAQRRPGVFVQASAVGYYGASDDKVLTENDPQGQDFLARVCVAWEASTAEVERLGMRRVIIRTGVVLSTQEGALPKLMLPFKLFAGGPLGNGKQWLPWIHINDEVNAIYHLILNPEARGAYHLNAPQPLTNRQVAQVLGKVLNRPAFFPTPAFALRLVLGEMATIVLDGQRTSAKKLQDTGFQFQFPEAEQAIRHLLAHKL